MRRSGRKVHGVVLLDKPGGMTSNAALQRVKHLFHAQKAGHTGSLDPIATGLLPICLGEATKMSGFLLDADKRYRTVVQLGVRTDTADADGSVIETRPVPPLNETLIEDALTQFRGEQMQMPPMHSAIKQNGTPLYKLAHQGLEVERESRAIIIFELRLIGFSADRLELEVHCSKGTYIRTLAEDIGAALGCGGHVLALQRTQTGPYRLDQAHTPERLQQLAAEGEAALDRTLLPLDSALADWPAVTLSDDTAFFLKRGQPVFVPKAATHGWVKIFAGQHKFLGVGEVLDDGRIAPRRLVNT